MKPQGCEVFIPLIPPHLLHSPAGAYFNGHQFPAIGAQAREIPAFERQ
jgi:hypothetical protein